jgi:hypothetical protein
MGQVRLLRPLGSMERYQLSKHLRRSAGPVVVAATLKGLPHRSTSGPDQAAYWHRCLGEGLASLCTRHPQLSLVVLDSAGAEPPRWAGLTQAFPVADVVACDLATTAHWDSRDLARALEAELQRDFDPAGAARASNSSADSADCVRLPLWRVRVLWHPDRPDECCLCWVWDHALADGLSGKQLLRSLVSRLRLPDAPTATPAVAEIRPFDFAADDYELPAPYDQRRPPSPSAATVAKALSGEKSPPYWAGHAAPEADATHRTRLALASVEPELCAALRAEGKQRGVSLHAILFTACAAALRAAFDVPPALGLKAATPISARRFCEPPVDADEVGNFIGGVETWLPLVSAADPSDDADEFWANCVAYGRHLSANLREGAALPGLLAHVGEWPAAWERLWRAKGDGNAATMRRTGSFELSDLGTWDEDDSGGEWRVAAVTFGQSVHVNGEALLCSVAGCVEGGLRVTVAWQDDTLAEAAVQRFLSKLGVVLTRLVS